MICLILKIRQQRIFPFLRFYVCQKSIYQIISDKKLFRSHKWISGEILSYNQVPIEWFILFFDKFAMFNPNVQEKNNLAPHPTVAIKVNYSVGQPEHLK